MSRTQTVTFNVGGEEFQVAHSLLDFYPESVLAKSISKRWKQPDQDANEEIFFDRCPQLFRQVLEYLRNKKVHLPITVSKTAVLSEFEHYCVDDVEEEAIDDSLTRSIQLVQSMKDVATHMKYFDGEVSRLKNEMEPLLNAETRQQESVNFVLVVANALKAEISRQQEILNAVVVAKALFKRFRSDPINSQAASIHWSNVIKDSWPCTDSIVIKINEYLARVGLKIARVSLYCIRLSELKRRLTD